MMPSLAEIRHQPLDLGSAPADPWGLGQGLNVVRDVLPIRSDGEAVQILTVNYRPAATNVYISFGTELQNRGAVPRRRLTIADLGMTKDEAMEFRASLSSFADDWDNEDSDP